MEYQAVNNAAYDTLADEYNEHWQDYLPSQRKVMAPFVRELRARFSNPSVLDVGCGVGLDAHLLASEGLIVHGIDASQRMIEHARRNAPNAQFEVADFLTARFSRPYDGIVMNAFIHLFPAAEVPRLFQKLDTVLASNGVVFISTTIKDTSGEGYEEKKEYERKVPRFRKHWAPEELRETLARQGYRLIDFFSDVDPVFKRHWVNALAEKSQQPF